MSYLSQLKNGRITAVQFLAKSTKWAAEKFGLTVDDDHIDKAVDGAQTLAAGAEQLVVDFIVAHVPGMLKETTEAIASGIGNSVLAQVDTALAAAGGAIKDATDEA